MKIIDKQTICQRVKFIRHSIKVFTKKRQKIYEKLFYAETESIVDLNCSTFRDKTWARYCRILFVMLWYFPLRQWWRHFFDGKKRNFFKLSAMSTNLGSAPAGIKHRRSVQTHLMIFQHFFFLALRQRAELLECIENGSGPSQVLNEHQNRALVIPAVDTARLASV